MATLSNEDIKRELGKNILLHPFKKDEVKGCSINLTASKLGWSLKTRKSIYDAGTDSLVIPPNDTALVETDESLWVSDKLCGTYHSKVGLVSQGIGHIGTTLDPNWIGPSLIALHNSSDKAVAISVGKSFVSIMLSYVKTKSTAINTNNAGRPELLNNYILTDAERNWLDEDWRSHKDKLREKMEANADYKQLKEQLAAKRGWIYSGPALNAYMFILCLVSAYVFYVYKEQLAIETKDYIIPILTTYIAGTVAQLVAKASS